MYVICRLCFQKDTCQVLRFSKQKCKRTPFPNTLEMSYLHWTTHTLLEERNNILSCLPLFHLGLCYKPVSNTKDNSYITIFWRVLALEILQQLPNNFLYLINLPERVSLCSWISKCGSEYKCCMLCYYL